jgi:hypothetical protein
LTELTNHLDKVNIRLEREGKGNLYNAISPTGKRLEVHFKQRNEGSTYRFQFKRGTYSAGDHVFMVCHNTKEKKMWVIPRRRWEQMSTDAGYCASDVLNSEARDCLFNFQSLLQ